MVIDIPDLCKLDVTAALHNITPPQLLGAITACLLFYHSVIGPVTP